MRKLLILFLFCSFYSFGQKVIDGDTFYYNNLKIRLYNIDALESSQPNSEYCKNLLIKLVRNKTLRYSILKYDRYGRAICKVYVGNKDVSLEMVRFGGAVVYRRYCSDSNFYFAEKEAKKQKKGIWKYNFINPEKFRKWKKN